MIREVSFGALKVDRATDILVVVAVTVATASCVGVVATDDSSGAFLFSLPLALLPALLAAVVAWGVGLFQEVGKTKRARLAWAAGLIGFAAAYIPLNVWMRSLPPM
jgi:hypothetical protein